MRRARISIFAMLSTVLAWFTPIVFWCWGAMASAWVVPDSVSKFAAWLAPDIAWAVGRYGQWYVRVGMYI